jgi:excisionase family DNA binding protein
MDSYDDDNAKAQRARKGSPYLTTEQAAFYVGLSSYTLQKMRRKARGPFFRKHGRNVRYHIADLDAWSNANGRLMHGPGKSSLCGERDDPYG